MRTKLLCSGFLLVLFSVSVEAQGNFVYANNDTFGSNSVSAFSISANGALNEVAASPFATGGTGFNNGFLASNRIVVSPTKPFLFVASNLSHDISVFRINSITGALSLAPGSPFPLMGDFIGAGRSLAVTPDGKQSHVRHDGFRTVIPGSANQ